VSRRQLNLAAPELLSAAKFAVRELGNANIRVPQVITRLQSAIEAAEGEDQWQLKFHVTHKTWEWILLMLRETKDGTKAHKDLTKMLKRGKRATARRIYLTVDVDIDAIARLRHLLSTYNPPTLKATSRAFDRIIETIDEQVMKSPLQLLAEAGF
jgi:hypothetical protein